MRCRSRIITAAARWPATACDRAARWALSRALRGRARAVLKHGARLLRQDGIAGEGQRPGFAEVGHDEAGRGGAGGVIKPKRVAINQGEGAHRGIEGANRLARGPGQIVSGGHPAAWACLLGVAPPLRGQSRAGLGPGAPCWARVNALRAAAPADTLADRPLAREASRAAAQGAPEARHKKKAASEGAAPFHPAPQRVGEHQAVS